MPPSPEQHGRAHVHREDPSWAPQSFTTPARAGAAPARWAEILGARPLAFVPCLRLRRDTLVAGGLGMGGSGRDREAEIAVIELSFDYSGTRVRARSRDVRPVVLKDGTALARDREGERRVRCLLETCGAVEAECLEEQGTLLGSQADYVVHLDGDVHAVCTFTAKVVPHLQSLGWQIELADDYKWKVVPEGGAWYARLDHDDTKPDWFNLELGVEIGGRRINLLPAMLDLLERIPPSARLETIIPNGSRSFALPLGPEAGYVLVPPDRLRIFMRVLHELYDVGEDGVVRFPAVKAASLAQIDEAFGGEGGDQARMEWQGATAVRERGQAIAAARPAAALVPPPGLQATLRPYQVEGLAFLQHLAANGVGGVLADDMGLGKTLQTIAHLVAEKASGRMNGPAVVVTPTSLIGNWRRELAKFAPDLKVVVLAGSERRRLWKAIHQFDVALITYGSLVRDEELWEDKELYLLILDEAQAIKNARSQARRAVSRVKSQLRLCLSGTPVENNLSEVWSLFDFLMPGLLGDLDWFRHRYAAPIEQHGDAERLRQLREQISPYILRRTKEEVARDLPPKTILVRAVDLAGKQRDLYESLRIAAHAEVRKAIEKKGLGASTITILDALMKLRQVCCDPRLLSIEAARDVRESAKHEAFMTLMREQLGTGRRVLVFSQFTTMLGLIGEALRAEGIRYVELTGQTPNRQKPVDAFEGRTVDVFLISLKAGGTGLNLTSADTVIHYDPWWNPAAQAQATDRAHRIGQTQPVFVHKLIVAGSVEEQMMRLQRRKQRLADGLLGRVDESRGPLSEQDVDTLFSPLEDDESAAVQGCSVKV